MGLHRAQRGVRLLARVPLRRQGRGPPGAPALRLRRVFTSFLVPAALGGLLWALPLASPSGSTYRLGVNLAIFGTLALGLAVIWGLCGQPSFGHAALFGVGAYTVAILTTRHGVGAWPALALAAGAGAVAGGLMGLPALRVRADQLALVTFAVGEGLRVVEANATFTNGSQGIPGVAPLSLGGQPLVGAAALYRPAVVLLACAYVLARALRASAAGRAMVAVGNDEATARALGVRPGPLKLAAFAFGGLLAGAAGGFQASFAGFVSSVSFGVVTSFQLVVMVILGGLGRLGPAVAGAAVVLLLDDRLQTHPSVRLAGTGLAMVAVVVLRTGAGRDGLLTVAAAVRRRLALGGRRESAVAT